MIRSGAGQQLAMISHLIAKPKPARCGSWNRASFSMATPRSVAQGAL
jgi:hypothetical protein